MHDIIHSVVLFIFVLVLLMLNIPKIAQNDHIKFKLYLFIGISIFEFIVELMITLHHKQLVNIGKMIKNSLVVALVAVVAYSIYTDLSSNDDTIVRNLKISIIIIIFIVAARLFDKIILLISPKMNDCLNTIYKF